MFAVGDMHAAMGDGEICFTGVEIAGEVDVRFDVLKGKQATWPVTELHDRWVPHASATDYAEALQLVSEEAAKLLVDRREFHDRGRVHLPLGRVRRRGRPGLQACGGLRHDRALLDPEDRRLPRTVHGVAKSSATVDDAPSLVAAVAWKGKHAYWVDEGRACRCDPGEECGAADMRIVRLRLD